ncbi:thaumatin family-domain-containing protein [Ilyonectria destructans]|nr:thaumatin family-domain-containing protein [Ilyonectria destructans]
MRHSSDRRRAGCASSICWLLIPMLSFGFLVHGVPSDDSLALRSLWADTAHHGPRIGVPKRDLGDSDNWDGKIPLIVTNNCGSTIWPGIATQAGTGPGTGGFALSKGKSRRVWVSPDWQGRVWGRTNCTVKGDSCSCKTGTGATPATLAEFNLAGGVHNKQTFYDISLVDGYNLPIGLKYIPAKNTSYIPPNLTNCMCIATPGWIYAEAETGTYYTNSSYPVPLETKVNNDMARRWCPWPYLAFPPTKPGDGIYPYPDDNIQRPEFAPCKSACAASGNDKDCCVGKYHDPDVCKPSDYSKAAKAMCPDAYSFAFDDQSSTFIIPMGGGWEITMCPKGRSTNILRQLGDEMNEIASSGKLSDLAIKRLKNVTYIESERDAANGLRPVMATLGVMV